MKRIFQIMLLLLLIIGNAYSQGRDDIDMNILIRDRDPNQFFKLIITSPESKDVWNIDSKIDKKLDSTNKYNFITAKYWYTIPGSYTLIYEVTDKKSGRSTKTSLEFDIIGTELKTSADLTFISSKSKSGKFLRAFYLYKYYNSSDSVVLNEVWIPTSFGEAIYKIINNSTVTIFGARPGGIFSGSMNKYVTGKWIDYGIPKHRATIIETYPILPGDSLILKEGDFIYSPHEFTPGRYKYCINYSHGETIDIFSNLNEVIREETIKGIINLYLLEKEFTIE